MNYIGKLLLYERAKTLKLILYEEFTTNDVYFKVATYALRIDMFTEDLDT